MMICFSKGLHVRQVLFVIQEKAVIEFRENVPEQHEEYLLLLQEKNRYCIDRSMCVL